MILIIGGSGVLGNKIISHLLTTDDVLIISNNRHEEVLKKFNRNIHVKEIFKLNLESSKDLNYFLNFTLKKHLKNITGVILNYAKTLNDDKNSLDEINKLFHLNYSVTAIIYNFFLIHLKQLKKHKDFRIVNILSNSIRTLNASSQHYIASKSAVESLSKFYAKNYGKYLIVNNVAPGLMFSNMTKVRFKNVAKDISKKTPIGRLIKPSEVAEVVRYLIKDSPVALTGQTIFVDGGRSI